MMYENIITDINSCSVTLLYTYSLACSIFQPNKVHYTIKPIPFSEQPLYKKEEKLNKVSYMLTNVVPCP